MITPANERIALAVEDIELIRRDLKAILIRETKASTSTALPNDLLRAIDLLAGTRDLLVDGY
jgi:hypothetical protein